MEFKELSELVPLNKVRIEKIAYKSNVCYKGNTIALIQVIRQIAVNIGYTVYKFDRLNTQDVVENLRKNCIKSFEKKFMANTRNTNATITMIEKHKRKESKSYLLYIHNQLWRYVNSNTKS